MSDVHPDILQAAADYCRTTSAGVSAYSLLEANDLFPGLVQALQDALKIDDLNAQIDDLKTQADPEMRTNLDIATTSVEQLTEKVRVLTTERDSLQVSNEALMEVINKGRNKEVPNGA